jgi:predicted amidohydrolase
MTTRKHGDRRVRRRGAAIIFGSLILLGTTETVGQSPAKNEASSPAAIPVVHFLGFNGKQLTEGRPAGWQTWSPRPEIAPRFSMDRQAGRDGTGALRIDGGGNPGSYGAWQYRVADVKAGRFYHLTAYFRAAGVPNERRSVSVRMLWLDSRDRRVRPPDYALDVGVERGWARVEHRSPAPEGAQNLVIELALLWAPRGTVWWDDIQILEEPSPHERVIRAVTIFCRPRNARSSEAAVAEFCALAEKSAPQKPDIICLPEGITLVGTGKTYADVSEPVPGPTTEKLGSLALKLHSYIVAGIFERVGKLVYNTAVLIDREGHLAGSYRKTHLPYEEVEGGISPGSSYPVFVTDFGKVGLLICWDVQFPEPARALALHGAEVILLPIWGGSEVLARARAIENHVFLITSSYDMKTFIVDPAGAVMAEANENAPIAAADINLDRKILQPWLGDMKTRTWKERRPDIPMP